MVAILVRVATENTGSAASLPTPQRTRTRSGCDCGGPCFYCGRALSLHHHEHDHFPIPARHGGETTVPSCFACHDLKDRTLSPGVLSDGRVDESILAAIIAGVSELPEAVSAETDDRLPVVVWALRDRAADWREAPPYDWPGDDWLADEIAALGRLTVKSVIDATTPEAKVYLAWLYARYLDAVDRALMQG
jgi:hypothetical protein